MPKMKSHSGVAKRFKKTGSGKLRRGQANKNHMLEKRSSRQKRSAAGDVDVSAADAKSIRERL